MDRETQQFRFDVGVTVFPSTGGILTTEGVDGVDLITTDARHHRVIHPGAFFEPNGDTKYDRRAVERLWPLEVGKRVRFVETAGSQRWVDVIDVARVETVTVPAGDFRAFVVERSVQSMAPGPRSVVTYKYWYAPDAGAIVKFEVADGTGKPRAAEADILGYPLPAQSPASAETSTFAGAPD